jgi:hypothetical protein
MEADTLWLTQAQMAALFQRDQSVLSRHLRNILNCKELEEKSNMQKVHTTLPGRSLTYYNLDVIISVGYRVNSKRGTQFRIWATRVLKDHLVNGCTANERRLAEIKQSLRLVRKEPLLRGR